MDARTPRRVLLVGSGSCGLVALRNLVERGGFEEEASLVERRDDVGGVWCRSGAFPGPYLEDPPLPGAPRDRPYWPSSASSARRQHSFSGACVDNASLPNPPQTHDYLKRFAALYLASGPNPLVDGGRLGRRAERRPRLRGDAVGLAAGSKGTGDGRDVGCGGCGHRLVRLSVVGRGNAGHEGGAGHAQTWKGPTGYEGKVRCLLQVSSAHAQPAARRGRWQRQFLERHRRPAQTRRTNTVRRQGPPPLAFLPNPGVVDVPANACYSVNPSDKLELELTDGHVLQDIDAIVLSTGYKAAAAPFVRILLNRTLTPLTSESTYPRRIPSLFEHILYAPTLAWRSSTRLCRVVHAVHAGGRRIDVPRLVSETSRLAAPPSAACVARRSKWVHAFCILVKMLKDID
ncbi:hypothetical protein HMN09_01178800 [Mycena chlorophos]|uniref:Flavin-containing monooxygenase n=1 Tax=Mycena chlorophos TaxID=658473 RepID=A0A8H6VZH2_MYCCL|nr:hypothetical protein HMN09_01178800 [Mycena chlorophos]